MTVQQMRYVIEVSKAGSITQAAKNLFITPSSISSGIASLEKELGYPIFSRSWQGVELTPKGRQVADHASYICERLQQIERGTVDTGRKGFCLVSGTYTPFNNAFSQLTKEYVHNTSARYVQQKMRDRFEGMDEVASNNADLLMICALDSSMSRFEPYVNKRDLAWELRKVVPAVALIGPGHRLYHEEEIRLDQLAGDAVIDSVTASMTDYGVFKQRIPLDPHHAILVQDRDQQFELVQSGAGYKVGPKQAQKTERRYGLRSIPIPNATFQIISITNPRIPMREELRRYLELVDAELDDIEV